MSSKRPKVEDVSLDLKLVGSLVRRARENLKLSYRELSQRCGVSPSQLLRIESGEFEYSIAKIFKVCVSLGLPLGAILEPATTRTVSPGVISLDDEAEWLLQESGPKQEAIRAARFEDFVRKCFEIAFAILTTAEPISLAVPIRFPFKDMSEHYCSFASRVEGFSNTERVTTMRALYGRPYEKLKSEGLITIEHLKLYLGGVISWKPAKYVPSGVAQTILDVRREGTDAKRQVEKFLLENRSPAKPSATSA